jgi:transcriptional regulator with XRE-family HTH domain
MSNIITGRQLRAARILAGLTQKQLAQACRCSRTRSALLGIEGDQSAELARKWRRVHDAAEERSTIGLMGFVERL